MNLPQIIKNFSFDKVAFTISREGEGLVKSFKDDSSPVEKLFELHRLDREDFAIFNTGRSETFNSPQQGIQIKTLRKRFEFNFNSVYFMKNQNGHSILKHFLESNELIGKSHFTKMDLACDFVANGKEANFFNFQMNKSSFGDQSPNFVVRPEFLVGSKGKQRNTYFRAENSRAELVIYDKCLELKKFKKWDLYSSLYPEIKKHQGDVLRLELRLKTENLAPLDFFTSEIEFKKQFLSRFKELYCLEHLNKQGKWEQDPLFVKFLEMPA